MSAENQGSAERTTGVPPNEPVPPQRPKAPRPPGKPITIMKKGIG